MGKPFFIEASFEIDEWSINEGIGDNVYDAIREKAKQLGLDPEEYEIDTITVDITCYLADWAREKEKA